MRDWIFLILGLILSIPVSIFANYITPYVVSYFRHSYLSMRESAKSTFVSIREIRKLTILDNYRRVQQYKENPLLMQIDFLENIAVVLSVSLIVTAIFLFCCVSTLIVGSIFIPIPNSGADLLPKIGYLLLGFFGMLICSTSMYSITNIYKLRNIDKLREYTIKQLIKLGYSQKDLEDFEWSETQRKALKLE